MTAPGWEFLGNHKMEVYSAQWCPDCRNLKNLLKRDEVPYTEVDIESTPGAADRLVAETGKQAIPFILVDGKKWVRGYHVDRPGRLDRATLQAELRAALPG